MISSFSSLCAFGRAAVLLSALLLSGHGRAQPIRTSGLLARGTPWENPWFITDSGIKGPTLLITGGMHGNEPAGHRAADQIRHWPIRRGRLIVVPRVNTPGLRADMRWLPAYRKNKALRDPNRNFPKTDAPDGAVTVPCKALWEFVRKQKPDWVVDLHEGYDFHISNKKSVGSSILFFNAPEMQRLAALIHRDVSATVTDPGRAFVLLSKGPVQGSLVRAAVERLGAGGFIFETTVKKQPVSTRTRQHRIMVHRLMRELKMTAGGIHVMASPHDRNAILVAVYDGGGVGRRAPDAFARILDANRRMHMRHVGGADIRAGVLEQFDVVIIPGGSGSKEARALGKTGRSRVKEFIRKGGGYIGVCAGAYLASANYDWSLGVCNTRTFTGKRKIPGKGSRSMWYRGMSDVVRMELTDEGRKILGDFQGPFDVRYHNGPILSTAGKPNLPAFITLAHFRSEVWLYAPQKGTMVNTPSIVWSPYGKGRVLLISPHPESTRRLHPIIERAVEWVARKRTSRVIGNPPLSREK